ncbi:hypothetical protein [Shewanella cyperi]|uniref:hypothetical protein n=1 Tax=Shewanella cyperi TaxID=2814292 RepID=UPI001A94FB04|nr:hypothetical protein [Shewanella cyperi]QSX41156.1 hypothetical protein JYB84_01565 [Shewanella cyperi]
MVGLDSIYAMLAKPVQAIRENKRVVEQLDKDTAIAADSHEAPQSQLPPKITKDRRKAERDRRNPDGEDLRNDSNPQYEHSQRSGRGDRRADPGHIDTEA